MELMDAFEADCLSDTCRFESITKGYHEESHSEESTVEDNVQEVFFKACLRDPLNINVLSIEYFTHARFFLKLDRCTHLSI